MEGCSWEVNILNIFMEVKVRFSPDNQRQIV